MPKIPTDYSQTIIYKIVCNDLNIKECYVGHTTNLINRKYQHKTSCNNVKSKNYNLKVYQTIRKNGGWENWTMIQIEEFPCKDATEARIKEREWYEKFNSKLNIQVPSQTQKEYIDKHKDQLLEYKVKWKQENKEHVDKVDAEYRAKPEVKEKQKQYREVNKEKIAEQKKEWYEKNKDEIHKEFKEKYDKMKDEICEKRRLEYAEKVKQKCPCGSTLLNETQHLESDKHKLWLNGGFYICECGQKMSLRSKYKHIEGKKHLEYLSQKFII